MAEKLFTEFPPVPKQTWEEAIIKDLKGADYQKKLVWKTMEGFSVQPYYRAEDLKDLKTLNSEAGQFPFIRGTKTNNTWLIRQDYLVMGNFKKANALALDGMMKGVTAVGYDLTETLKVSKDELRTLLKGFSFKAVEINFKGCKDLSLLRNFIAIVKEEGVKPADVRASFDYDPLKEMNLVGRYAKSAAVKQLREAIELSIEYPNISVIGIYAYLFNNAGSTITQELAYGMSMGSEYLNLLQ